jgi:hypothetical protein
VPDLGFDWVVRPGRDDLPPVAQGHSANKTSACMIVEVVLVCEGAAERGELAGPGGRFWTCSLDNSAEAKQLYGKGLPCWDPERPLQDWPLLAGRIFR